MDKAELKVLLETPLDPNLDYFDATASIEAMANHIRGLHILIKFLADTLALQGQSIIEMRKENVEVQADLLAAGIGTTKQDEGSSIIMPNRELVRPN